MAAFPPMDFKRFEWRSSPKDQQILVREAMGGELIEDFWNRFNHGEQTLFIGVEFKNLAPVSSDVLVEKARAAWAHLRFLIPTVASGLDYDEQGRVLMTYKIAKSQAVVDAWIARTFRVQKDVTSLDDLRYVEGQAPLPDSNGDITFMHFVPDLKQDTFGVLFHTHHTPFDGAGIKIVMSKFVKLLAANLTGTSDVKPSWGEEVKNLEPAASSILADDQITDGPVYQETLGTILTSLATGHARAHGFKNTVPGHGPNRRHQFKFSSEESSALLNAAKAKGFTINHVAHGALSMVCAEDNPLTESSNPDAAMLYYGLVDARKRLVEPYKSQSPYSGYCLAMSPIIIPMSSFKEVKDFAEASVLKMTAGMVKEQYQWQKAAPALLGVIAQEVELMLAPLNTMAAEAEKAGQKFAIPPWLGPWYAGDGIIESYLPDQIADGSGKVVFTVQDVFLSLTKVDPGPFFRMYSFKNELILSADHNEKAMAHNIVEDHMKRWVDFIRLILA